MSNFDFRCMLVESVDEAQAFLRWLSERRPVLAIDTETSGLKPYTEDVLRVVQFGDGATGWVIPYDEWRGVIRQALSQYEGPIVGHNWNFDRAFLTQAGLPDTPVHRLHDTMTMSHILDPARSHGLKSAADRYWPGASAAEFDLKSGMTVNKWTWGTVPIDFEPYWTYAASDVVWTTRLAEKWWPEIQVRGMTSAYQREMAVNDIAFRMQARGLLIDTEYTSNLLDEWLTEMEQVETELHALGVANPSAGQQVAAALQLTEDWEPDAWTDTGLPKVDEKVLVGIDSEIARKVLRYRRLRKWTKAYLSRFLQERDAYGRVHPDLKPLRARTGRWSITGPPLQTLPRGAQIRNCVVPNEGGKLLSVDYDGVEARIFAHYSREDRLIKAFKEGLDVHTYTASEAYQIPMARVTPAQRQIAKAVTFAKLYGAGPAKIADTAGITESEARDFLARYDLAFPGVPAFMETVDRLGRLRLADTGAGYVTSWGGRYIPCAPTRIYSLVNYLVQGSAADALKVKMIELDAAGYGDLLLMPIHDELLFDVPASDFLAVRTEVQQIMEFTDEFAVPLTTHAGEPQSRWGTEDLPDVPGGQDDS